MKNKQLQKWALGAEIMSAVAVVVTIGFLALQMMDNTDALRAQMYHELIRDINDRRLWISRPEYIAINRKLVEGDWESLTYQEQVDFATAAGMLWSIYESAYFANRRGVLGPSEFARFQAGFCHRFSRDQQLWNMRRPPGRPLSEMLSLEFVEQVEATCQ